MRHIRVLLIGALLLLGTGVARADDKYDPTADPAVQSYLVCIELASGGADNSNAQDVSAFDKVGYAEWANGTTKAIECQQVDKT